MCGTTLWVSKQDDSTTLQSTNSMIWWPSLQRRRIEIRGRTVESVLSNCSETFFWWHVVEDPMFYGQWTNLHDQLPNGPKHVTNDWIVWSPTFITQVNTNNIVMWETLQNNASWDCFKFPISQKILRIQKLLQVEHCVFFGSHTFVPISWMCKKQTSVSHSSTESEIISLDSCLRMDGFPSLGLWHLIVTVLHGNTNQNKQVQGNLSTSPTRKKLPGKIDDLNNVDIVSSNASSSRQEALLYIFEDNEAVIKMTTKERSARMRHVSRTHRVAWLVVRSNLSGLQDSNQIYWHLNPTRRH